MCIEFADQLVRMKIDSSVATSVSPMKMLSHMTG